MAKSPFGVLAPTIFVLMLIIVGFIIYNAQQNPEDPKKKNLLDSLGVVQGTDVDVFENSSEDFNSVKERYDELKERLSKYGDIIDVEEYIKTLDLECAVYPGKDGCDPDLFDTDTRGCCVLKNPDLADDPELLDTTGQQSTVQDATMNLDCLGLPEAGDDPCPNTNERYDANAVDGGCCVRACSVYPINGKCDSNPNFPNLENGCCEPDDRTKERLEREMREAKREMLIGIAAMILGDMFLTVMLPKLGQEILNMSAAKEIRVTAAGTAAVKRAENAADARGITGEAKTKMIENAKRRAEYAERWKNTKSVKELVKHVETIKTQKAATGPGSKAIRELGERSAKRLATALAKASAKFAAKVGARIAIFIARAMVKLSSGPLALFLLMFDVVSIVIDLGDGEELATYVSFDDMVKQRNKIIFKVWDIFKKAEGGPYDYPIVYPVTMAFPDEATNAQAKLNQKCVEDTLTKWVTIGAQGLTEENERDFNVFCKYIMLNVYAETYKDENGGSPEFDLYETMDALNDEEEEIINMNTANLIKEDPITYWKFYFDELCQELENSGTDQLDDAQWRIILEDGPHPADCPSSDLSLLQNMKPDRSMVKFVGSMCDATNSGISLTERGCYYINRPAKRRAWELYNSIYKKAPYDLTETTNMFTASYDTHVLTIDDRETAQRGPHDGDNPPVVKVHRRDLNDQPLTEKIGWFTPYGFLVSLCEGERDTNESGGGRAVRPCAENGVHFDVNTGLCNITNNYCNRYIRGDATREVYVEDQNALFPACVDYSPTSDVGIKSWIIGDEWSVRYNEQRDEAKNSIDKFMDDPSAENFGQALYENVGLEAQTLIGKVQDEWKNNEDKYEKKEEAVARTVMDPLGFGNFVDNMGDKLGGKDRYCEPPDDCKVVYAKHTGGNFQNWVVLVKEYDENDNEEVIRYPNSSVSDQNQVKDGEQHQFYIPGARQADSDKGIKRRSAGWFRATAVGDIEGDLGVFNIFTGGDESNGCYREITFPYEQIETPGPDDPTPVLDISSWRGCMQNKAKAGWQEEFSKYAEAGWEFVADSYKCGEEVVFKLGLTYMVEGGKYAVEGTNIAYDELKEVFSEDGYFANPDKFMADLKTRIQDTGIDEFGYKSAANVGDCLGITDGDCNLLFGEGKDLPPEIQNEIDNFNNKKNIWKQNKEAHDKSLGMVIDRAKDIGKYQKGVVDDVGKIIYKSRRQ